MSKESSRRTSAKMKESEKLDEYMNLAREVEKLWHIKMTVIPIVDGSLETISK